MSRSVLRTSVVVVMSIALLVAWQRAGEGEPTADGPFKGGIIVVGDSITAEYNDDEGDDFQGWWSITPTGPAAEPSRTGSSPPSSS